MAGIIRIQVLLPTEEAERFNAYCHEKAFKKSTLIARLIREHLKRESFQYQPNLFQPDSDSKDRQK